MLKLETEFSIQMLLLCSESRRSSSWQDMLLSSNRSSGGGEMLRTGRLEGVIWCCCWVCWPPFSPQTLPESLFSAASTSAFLRLLTSPGVLLSFPAIRSEAEVEEVGKALRGLPVLIAEEADDASVVCTIKQWIKASVSTWANSPSQVKTFLFLFLTAVPVFYPLKSIIYHSGKCQKSSWNAVEINKRTTGAKQSCWITSVKKEKQAFHVELLQSRPWHHSPRHYAQPASHNILVCLGFY